MRPVHPIMLHPGPSPVAPIVGGAAGTLLLAALINLAPIFGVPYIDVPRLTGGMFTNDPAAAFWLGYSLFLLVPGIVVFPSLLGGAWHLLPGPALGPLGGLVKGGALGLVLWMASGLTLPLAGVLCRLPGVQSPGFFGAGLGLAAILGLLAGHLVYGVAVALVTAVEQGITVPDTLGWGEFGHASGGVLSLGMHRAEELPEVPAGGERPGRRGR